MCVNKAMGNQQACQVQGLHLDLPGGIIAKAKQAGGYRKLQGNVRTVTDFGSFVQDLGGRRGGDCFEEMRE